VDGAVLVACDGAVDDAVVASGAVSGADGVPVGAASAAGAVDSGVVDSGDVDAGADGVAADVDVSVGSGVTAGVGSAVAVSAGADVDVDDTPDGDAATAIAGTMPKALVTRTVPVAAVMRAAVRQLGRCFIGSDSSTCRRLPEQPRPAVGYGRCSERRHAASRLGGVLREPERDLWDRAAPRVAAIPHPATRPALRGRDAPPVRRGGVGRT